MNYICEKCGAVFTDIDECSEHEKTCTQPPIKAIMAQYEPQNALPFRINVVEYPDTSYERQGSMVYLVPGESDSCKFESDLHLDEVQDASNYGLIIYTTNFDKKYEKICVIKLVERMVHDLTEEAINTLALRDRIKYYLGNEYPENEIIHETNKIIY